MDWVRPTAIWAMAALVPATGPPSPMFSPQAVQVTPAAVSRAPRSASPGHWWERPQPPAIVALCREALAFRPAVMVSGARPAAERAWLISASTWAAGPPGEVPGEPAAGAVGEDAARLGDADAGGDDGRARGCVARACDDGEPDAGTVATAALNGRPAHDSAVPAAAGSQAEGVGRAVTRSGPGAAAGAGAGPRAR